MSSLLSWWGPCGGMSRWMPSIASPALILVIDGKPKLCWAVGSVMISVVGWKGKPSALWTFPIINLSSFSVSSGKIGWRDSSAWHLEIMFCVTIFQIRVIGRRPMMVGNWKVSMKLWRSLNLADGLSTLVWRKSKLSLMSAIICSVIANGSTSLPPMVTDLNVIVFG